MFSYCYMRTDMTVLISYTGQWRRTRRKEKSFEERHVLFLLFYKKLIYSPSPLKFASTVVLRTYTHINRYEAHHIPQHPSMLHLTCTTCDMIAIYTHTHKHIQMPTCSSLLFFPWGMHVFVKFYFPIFPDKEAKPEFL